MLEIRRLVSCPLEAVLEVWNRGFEGYYVNVRQTADTFVNRMAMEGLSPDLSVVAFVDGKPAGLVLNGIRVIDGQKVAWNGGTAVVPAFRRNGAGRALIQASLDIYRENGVQVATLEAFRQNEPAISLYRRMGYEVVDELLFLQCGEAFAAEPFAPRGDGAYEIRHGTAHDIRSLPFYRTDGPWQTQWQSARDGESLIAVDSASGEPVGCALFRRVYDADGALASIALLQCEAQPGRSDESEILRALLRRAFTPWERACRRTTFNLPASRKRLIDVLAEEGFTPSVTQVWMKRPMV